MVIGEWELISKLFITDFADEVFDFFEPEYLTDKMAADVFRILADENDKKQEHDLTTVIEKLKTMGYSHDAAMEITKKIIDTDCIGYDVVQSAKTLAGRYQAEKLKTILNQGNITALNVYEIADRVQYELQSLKEPVQSGITADDMVEMFSQKYFCPRPPYRYKTGFECIDTIVRMEAGDLFIIGARPGVGKSSLALNFGINMALNGLKVLYFNLEMNASQIYERIMARLSGIELGKIRNAEATSRENLNMFAEANKRWKGISKNFILQTGDFTCSKIRQIVRQTKPDIVFIDYIQLIIPTDRYKGNKVAEVTEISNRMKSIAKQFEIPIVALSQLHRVGSDFVETKKDDLKESGSLEQDASIVLVMWLKDEKDRSKMGIKIDKNRQGSCDSFNFDFNAPIMTFTKEGNFRKAKPEEIEKATGKKPKDDLPFGADEE